MKALSENMDKAEAGTTGQLPRKKGFWSMAKFTWLPKHTFHLHRKADALTITSGTRFGIMP